MVNTEKLKKASNENFEENLSLEVVNEILDMVPYFHESFIRLYERTAISMFTQLQLTAMRLIINNGPMPMNKIASQLSMSKQQLTRFIDTLVQRGMMKRFNKDNDRRTIYIDVTDEGLAKVAEHNTTMKAKHLSKLENASDEELKDLYEAAHKFKGYLEKYWGTEDDK